jgi:hypothetical protein
MDAVKEIALLVSIFNCLYVASCLAESLSSKIDQRNGIIIFNDTFGYGNSLSQKHWTILTDSTDRGNPAGSKLRSVPQRVQNKDGALQILIGHEVDLNTNRYTVGDVTGKDLLKFGEVQWEMRVITKIPGIHYRLGLTENMCQAGLCWAPASQSIYFKYNSE